MGLAQHGDRAPATLWSAGLTFEGPPLPSTHTTMTTVTAAKFQPQQAHPGLLPSPTPHFNPFFPLVNPQRIIRPHVGRTLKSGLTIFVPPFTAIPFIRRHIHRRSIPPFRPDHRTTEPPWGSFSWLGLVCFFPQYLTHRLLDLLRSQPLRGLTGNPAGPKRSLSNKCPIKGGTRCR